MEVSPSILEFTGSFTKQTTEYLTLSNPTSSPLAFKVKTTAPKLYCVRPNASIVQPGDSVQISIILQGFSQPLPTDYKCKDKFLLVSLPAPNSIDPAKVGDSWSQLEAQNKSQMISKKLRVNYVIGPDKPDTNNANINSNQAPVQQQQQQQQQQQAPVQQSPVQQQPQYTQQPSQQSIPQQQSHVGAGIGGAAVAAGAAAVGYNQNQQHNGDTSFNQTSNRSFDTSSVHNGFNNNQPPPQQQQQQPYGGSSYQQQPPQQQQFQQGGYQGSGAGVGYGSGVQAAGSQPSPEVQRELEALARQVQSLNSKLDQNEKTASRNTVSSLVGSGEEVSGVSLPVALVLVLIAFLLGWLVF